MKKRGRYKYTPKRRAALRKAQLTSARKRRGKKIAIAGGVGVGVLAVGVGAGIVMGRKDTKHGSSPRDVIKHAPPQAKANAPEARDIVHENVRGFDQPKQPVSQSVSETGKAPSASKTRSRSSFASPPKPQSAESAIKGNIARRVMVSGSRIHSNPQEVFDVLENEYRIRGPMTVVHGDAVRGSDRYARLWSESALSRGYKIIHDPHPVTPAEWERYGKSAGHKRNQKMVDLGPEVVYAFPRGKASGTRGAMNFARIAGIKVVEL